MKISEIINEVFLMKAMATVSQESFDTLCESIIATPGIQVRENSYLHELNGGYVLTKNKIPVAYVRLVDDVLLGEKVKSIKIVYIPPQYRKTSAMYWLLYAVKETINVPTIVDGSIFKDGQALIAALIKHDIMRVEMINRYTDELEDSTGFETVYKLTATPSIGVKKVVVEGIWEIWYPLFDEYPEY